MKHCFEKLVQFAVDNFLATKSFLKVFDFAQFRLRQNLYRLFNLSETDFA